jgi:outer membrane protein OmpA-like peptidoglycan-associated protein
VARLEQENQRQAAAARAEADRAATARTQAEAEKTELRAQLLQQFSTILEARDSARGLIVNMSDVLFDTGKYTLRSAAREKLAKVAGVVSGHVGLSLQVEGHTDNVGSDEYNQNLSEQRGAAVRDFLAEQGIPADALTTRGFGESKPTVSNDTAAGRQQNRRVELVVSGEMIGQTETPTAALQ